MTVIPRRRESSKPPDGSALQAVAHDLLLPPPSRGPWIPAYAGMTEETPYTSGQVSIKVLSYGSIESRKPDRTKAGNCFAFSPFQAFAILVGEEHRF